jgi:hypothetical protein
MVSSVHAADFSLSEKSPLGPRLLRDYLRFAETGNADETPATSSKKTPRVAESDCPLEDDIATAVRDLGLETALRVGSGVLRIDIGVRDPSDPDRFILGIESDGESYVSTPTARDRDRLREEVLHGLGWNLHRIWSVDWVRNRAAEIERIQAALKSANRPSRSRRRGIDDASEMKAPSRRERSVLELKDASDAGNLPWVATFARCELSAHPPALLEFHDPAAQPMLASLLERLVKAEAPIHESYAIRRLAEAWGLRRAGHRIAEAGTRTIASAARKGSLERRDGYLWKPQQTIETVRIPDPSDERTRRDIDEIPPQEIDIVIAHLRSDAVGAPADQMLIAVSRVLGFDRLGPRIREVLTARLETSKTSGDRHTGRR